MYQKETLNERFRRFSENEAAEADALTGFDDSGAQRRLTYRQLNESIMCAAAYLRDKASVKKGSRCIVVTDDDMIGTVVSFFAVTALGAAAVPVQADTSDDKFNRCRYITENCGADIIIAGGAYDDMKRMFPDKLTVSMKECLSYEPKTVPDICARPEDEMMVLYTSGSTSEPKAVVYTNGMISSFAELYSRKYRRDKDSAALITLPVYHAFGNGCTFFPQLWGGGASVIVKPDTFINEPGKWFRLVTRYRITHMAALNYTVSVLADHIEKYPEDVAGSDLSSLKALTIGGEYIQADTVNRFTRLAAPLGFDSRSFSVCYGMTELMILANTPYFAGLKKADASDESSEYNTKDIFCAGEVSGNRKVICTDENDDPVKNGKIGNICVTADPVMKSFTGLEAVNVGGDICYKTGDVGFVLENDSGAQEVYICGRSKDILNIKGELYSPFIVEEIIENADDRIIRAVAISVMGNDTEHLEVAAECVGTGSQQLADKLNEALIKRLPIDIKRVVFVSGGALPKTQMGKIIRRDVRRMMSAEQSAGVSFAPAVSIVPEKTDAFDIISSFLKEFAGADEVGNDTEIKSLGLNSLSSQLLASRTGLALSDIFSSETVGDLCRKAAPSHNVRKGAAADRSFPLNDIQRAYITGRNDEVDWGGVPCQYYTERDIKGLDTARFTEAVQTLMQRHPMLRSAVKNDGHMELLDDHAPPVTVRHYCDDIGIIADETRRRMTSIALPLDAPLFEIVLNETEKDLWRIHLRIDMICCDAMSMLIFWNDLFNIYDGEQLPETVHEAACEETAASAADEEYWDKKAAEFPPIPQLPYNSACERTLKGKIKRYQMLIEKERFTAFEELAKKLGLTVSAAFMALFTELLSAYGAGREMALNVTVMGRKDSGIPGRYTAGEFTKLLLFAAHRDDVSVLENALRIQEDIRRDMAHLSVSGFETARKISEHTGSDVVYPIVFTSLLGLEKLTGGRSIFSSTDHSASSTPQVLLDHQLLPAENGVILNWDIAEEAFEDGIAEAMFKAYKRLISQAFEESFWHSRVTDIRSEEDRTVQSAANDTAVSMPKKLLTDGFSDLAENNGNTAVIHLGRRYSYAELKKRSAQYGEMLTCMGVGTGDRVMVQMSKSFELIAAITGIVRIGAVYVPMPSDQPESRQYEIYGKCAAKGILADESIVTHESIPRFAPKDADSFEGSITDAEISPDSLAYIIFTSGSTGTPKGVAITHAAAMNTILAVNSYVGLKSTDTLIGLSSVSFDLSVYDIFGAVSAGAALAVPTEAERIDPAAWLKICREYGVTVWNTVPALMDIFLDHLKNADTSGLVIRDVILSGDWIPMDLYGRLKELIPSARLTSMGGATEASIWSNYFTVNGIDESWNSVPYGYPLANQTFHVLDDFGRPLPCGVSGRLHIGGSGLAECYYNEPVLTEKAFSVINGERLYDTGDYGRYDKNGCLIFMGRKDSQIKVNGYRIELGEIQSALANLGYPENIVAVSDTSDGRKELFAFIQTKDDISEAECKNALTGLLPHYFVPKRITSVRSFPMTANGKIDRKKLLENISHERRNKIHETGELSDRDRKILDIIGSELNITDVSPDDSITGLGLTSLSLIKLANRLESEMGHRARVNDIIRYKEVRDFLEYYHNDPDTVEKEREAAPDVSDDPCFSHPVMDILRDELELPGLRSDDPLRESGLSSIAVIRTANRLDMLYGFRPSVKEISAFDTAKQLIDFYGDAAPLKTEESVHSKAERLVEKCRSMDITIWAEEGRLRFKAPKGALTPELKKELSEAKNEIIKYLESTDSITVTELTALQTAYVVGRQNSYALGDITANYYVEYSVRDLDVGALEKALNTVIEKNEILKTVIYPNGTAKALKEVPYYSIEVAAADSGRDLRAEMSAHSFELGKWPMLDIKVKKTDTAESIVHIDIDCLILDGWSIRSFLSQLLAAYMGSEIVTTDYTFRQYLADEQKWIKEKHYYVQARRYWEKQINELPPAPHLPMKTPIAGIRRPVFSRKSFTLDKALTEKLWDKMRRYGLTPSLVLCTAYMMSLSKWSSNPDVTLDITMFNRQPVHRDVQKVLGDFTNIALIGYRHKECSFLEHTSELSRQLWNAIEYRSCNVINMLGILAKKYDDEIAAPYVFTSLIDVDDDTGHSVLSDAGFTEIFAQTRTPQVLFDHQLYYSGGKLVLGIDYVEQAFDDDMLEGMFKDYTDRVALLAETEDWEDI